LNFSGDQFKASSPYLCLPPLRTHDGASTRDSSSVSSAFSLLTAPYFPLFVQPRSPLRLLSPHGSFPSLPRYPLPRFQPSVFRLLRQCNSSSFDRCSPLLVSYSGVLLAALVLATFSTNPLLFLLHLRFPSVFFHCHPREIEENRVGGLLFLLPRISSLSRLLPVSHPRKREFSLPVSPFSASRAVNFNP